MGQYITGGLTPNTDLMVSISQAIMRSTIENLSQEKLPIEKPTKE